MKTRTIYWVLTIGLAWELGFGGISDLLRLDYVRMTVEQSGRPDIDVFHTAGATRRA
jgi:hypothetical protein